MHTRKPRVTNSGVAELRRSLRAQSNATDAQFLQRFFKTGPGQYAEGDRFLGGRVPATASQRADTSPVVSVVIVSDYSGSQFRSGRGTERTVRH